MLVWLWLIQFAFADTARTVDISPAVSYYAQFVHTLDQPTYTWNWFGYQSRDPIWQTKLPADHRAGLDHARGLADKYWRAFCSPDATQNSAPCQPLDSDYGVKTNMYGPGLYLAVDPVVTQRFGGKEQEWVLLQVRLPARTKYIDIMQAPHDVPSNVRAVFAALNCPVEAYTRGPFLNYLLSSGSTYFRKLYATPDSCKDGIRKIFQTELGIDAFFFEYETVDFPECRQNPHHGAGILLINPDLLEANDVRVFNRLSTDDISDRARIQSLFYKAMHDMPEVAELNYAPHVPASPDPALFYQRIDFKCSNSLCTAQAMYCRRGQCQSIAMPDAPVPAYPTAMSQATAPLSQALGNQSLLWPDLEGHQTDPDISNWMHTNLAFCK